MHRESVHGTRECSPGGTTYGAVDGPGGPSVAAVLGPGGPSMATKTCHRWFGGIDFGGTIHGMTVQGYLIGHYINPLGGSG